MVNLSFRALQVLGCCVVFTASGAALADDAPPASPPPDEAAKPAAEPAPEGEPADADKKKKKVRKSSEEKDDGDEEVAKQPEEDEDEPRFRGGISIGGGGLFYSGAAAGLGTVDGRIGVQIMDLLGVYVQPHLALGAGSGAFAGSAGGTLVVDFTFIDHIFVGVGGGGGLVQFGGTVPAGELHVRVGGYPVVGDGLVGGRRKGLMIGADLHVHFADGAVLPSPTVSIGYEAF
ncbi:MAG: hypothetical protein IPM79_34930 [Polyangiaceae bacterium]|jgi:hypothetical protein|nr:hypothetical protein [Polyangiaceae bacterium]MBK8942652.1 hypothetical protein [Polyangiaceae bacterium]